MSDSLEKRLEKYTLKKPQEVLLVSIATEEEEHQIAIFRGFSSSLTGPTSADPDEPIIPKNAKIVSIDRVVSPYNPENPKYIQQDITQAQIEEMLGDQEL